MVGEGNETLFIRVWKPISRRRVLKNFERKPEKESSKRTIFARSELGRLQMMSEPDIRHYASEDVGPRGGGGHQAMCQ